MILLNSLKMLTRCTLVDNTGEVASPLPLTVGVNSGELRLESDFLIARDSRTACFWQSMISMYKAMRETQILMHIFSFVDEEELMASRFKEAMSKMAVIGHNPADLIDCSAVVPKPVPALNKPAT